MEAAVLRSLPPSWFLTDYYNLVVSDHVLRIAKCDVEVMVENGMSIVASNTAPVS